jgi:hypothetical protein
MALRVEVIRDIKSVIKKNSFLMKEGVVYGSKDSILPKNIIIEERHGIARIIVDGGTISGNKDIGIARTEERETTQFCGIGKEVVLKSPEELKLGIKEIRVRQIRSDEY